jgi:hypothetical protein
VDFAFPFELLEEVGVDFGAHRRQLLANLVVDRT